MPMYVLCRHRTCCTSSNFRDVIELYCNMPPHTPTVGVRVCVVLYMLRLGCLVLVLETASLWIAKESTIQAHKLILVASFVVWPSMVPGIPRRTLRLSSDLL
jgi:hypothetical protein